MIHEGLLLARLVPGVLIAAHGAQKLFGWLGGYGIAGTGGFFEGLGFKPGRLFAGAAGLGELAGGVLMALGLFGPVGPALVLAVMIVAMIAVHWSHGLFATTNGIELPLLYAAVATALAVTGPGRYSLDAWLGLTTLATPAIQWIAIVAGIVGGVVALTLRRTTVAA